MAEQQTFPFRTRGGRRPGAGRPRTRTRPAMPHVCRESVRPYEPVLVTLRMAEWVWNLRSERSFRVIHRAFEAARHRPDSRIVHFTIIGNHVHMIVEAAGERSLSNSVRALSIRLARGLNKMMGRRGKVLEDRYHAHVLRTPTEARNATRYVLGNFASHAARRGVPTPDGWVDPFSSPAMKMPREPQLTLFHYEVTEPARTWLMRNAAG